MKVLFGEDGKVQTKRLKQPRRKFVATDERLSTSSTQNEIYLRYIGTLVFVLQILRDYEIEFSCNYYL